MTIRSSGLPDRTLEIALSQAGTLFVAGLDEAGRGAWAGPVTAAAVILPPPEVIPEAPLQGLQDSKQLSAKSREDWDRVIRRIALSLSVGQATVAEIDQVGILPATRLAMQRAVHALERCADHLLIDYILIGDVGINQTAIPYGDRKSLSIAAASVVAKVSRDRIMTEFDRRYPGFGFAQHKGYGTPQHQNALDRLGPTPIHRRSFEPTRRALAS